MTDDHEEWDEIVAEVIEEDFVRRSTDHARRRPTPRALSMVDPAGGSDRTLVLPLRERRSATLSASKCLTGGEKCERRRYFYTHSI
ncbi:hypothetical protein BRD12_01550 [Halobacteriales archaeon SW_12_67_38]|nr:MAG: hypothetical protein BRD12_01550 [Halobacteriales archaeon SW_12_67_38]